MKTIEVHINQQKETIPQGVSILQLLEQKNISPLGLAVAIDHQVIPKTKWAEVIIDDKQEITIIRATQGG